MLLPCNSFSSSLALSLLASPTARQWKMSTHQRTFTPVAAHHHVQRMPRLRFPSLSLSATNSKDNNSTDKLSKTTKTRKRRILNGYRFIAASYVVAIGALLKKAGLNSRRLPFVAYNVADPLMAAGMTRILARATIQDKLPTSTNKRLNLGLAFYGIINLFLVVLTVQFTNPIWWYCVLVALGTFATSMKGYGYGVKGWILQDHTTMLVRNDINKGIQYNIKALTSVPSNLQSLIYLVATITLTTLSLLKLADTLRLVVSYFTGTVAVPLQHLSQLGKSWLLTIASLTLKTGADHGRLENSTMIQLNYLMAYSFGTMAGTYDHRKVVR